MRDFDREKFKALVQYVCYRADPRRLGATKLNKILWFADMLHYVETGRPLTGETYVKRKYGPAPKHMLSILDELETEQLLAVRQPEFEGENRLFIATTKPSLKQFDADQISLVDRLVNTICRQTAKAISDVTHDRMWEIAELGEEIPYEAFLAWRTRAQVTEVEVRWAQEAIAGANRN